MKPSWIVVALSLALNTAVLVAGNVVEKRTTPEDFDRRYLPIARGISERGEFLLDGRAPSPPIYPLALSGLIAVAGPLGLTPLQSALMLNVLAAAAGAWIFFLLAGRHLPARTALLAAAVWLTYPFCLYLTLLPGPEHLYLLALLLAAWTALEAEGGKPPAALAAGAASALAMLVKPMALFLPLVLLVFLMVAWTRRLVPAKSFVLGVSAFIIGLLFTLLPWEVYLWQRTGKFVPVAELAGSSMLDGWTFGLKPGTGGDRMPLAGDVENYMLEVERSSPGKESREVLSAIRQAAGERPGAFVKLLMIKASRCWYGTDEMWHEGKTLAIQALYLVLSLMGAVIWLRGGRPGGALVAALSCLLLYHWAAATAALSILRYMVPAAMLMSILAAFTLGSVLVRAGPLLLGKSLHQSP